MGNPAISIPAGTVDGLPVGMQVIGRHHEDALLLDLALVGRARAALAPGGPGAPLTGVTGTRGVGATVRG